MDGWFLSWSPIKLRRTGGTPMTQETSMTGENDEKVLH